MKVRFWLLDVNYEVKGGLPELWIWGITESSERILVIDRSFSAYFYAVVEENHSADAVAERILKERYTTLSKVEPVERRFFGRPVKAVKVYCKNPDVMPKLARELRRLEGVKDCFEDDIRYSMRYLIDNNVIPSTWHEAEVIEGKSIGKIRVDKVYTAKSVPKPIDRTDVPALRILAFSTIYYSKEGSPKPERNPVIMISTVTNDEQHKEFLTDKTGDDQPILEAFIKYVKNFNPDIIVGYGVNGQDWPYLVERCRKAGLRLRVDRAETEPHTSVYSHVSLTGRAGLDLADYADGFADVKVKTLANLAAYLGVMKLADRVIVEEVDYASYWDDPKKREDLKRFSMDNARCIKGVTDAILDFAMQLSSLVGLPLDHVGTAAAGFRVEWFLIKSTHKIGELVPKRLEQPYRPYTGGLVLTPKSGLHENVAVLDFKSMYPSLMIAYNLSPDTYIGSEDPLPREGFYEAPEVNHRFRKEPPGFYKEVLTYLISVRNEIKLKMKKLRPTSMEYRVLDARQKAVKVITNATYGYAGWTGARWYVKPVAEAAAAWGRHTISRAIKMAEDMALEVVYGDTDSIFVQYDDAKVTKLSKDIKNEMGLEIKPDKIYVRIFFTEAKKRYAGLMSDGELDVVGLEVMRGDWAGIAKEAQENVLDVILREKSPEKAVAIVEQYVYRLRKKQVPYRDLIIWKTQTKQTEEYEVNASHVEAAKMLRAKGWELSVGDKVGYVIVTGKGRLFERVKPYVFATYDDVDVEYYVTKQIVPAAARVLAFFGKSEEDLLKTVGVEKKSKKLSDFFAG
jgi:DNA polymerase I